MPDTVYMVSYKRFLEILQEIDNEHITCSGGDGIDTSHWFLRTQTDAYLISERDGHQRTQDEYWDLAQQNIAKTLLHRLENNEDGHWPDYRRGNVKCHGNDLGIRIEILDDAPETEVFGFLRQGLWDDIEVCYLIMRCPTKQKSGETTYDF